jgi:hypothetical protein
MLGSLHNFVQQNTSKIHLKSQERLSKWHPRPIQGQMGDPTNQHKKAMPTKIYPIPCPLVPPHWQPIGMMVSALVAEYLSTLANLTLIILFSEMLKFSKIISSKSKNIVKDNSEYLWIFYLLK